jgi:hypothetical protein
VGRPAAVFGLILAALAMLGVFAYTQLEIYPRSRMVKPLREALENEYLALERWLARTGHSLRTESWGNPKTVLAAPEKTVFIQTSLFYWSGDAGDLLLPWIEEGGALIIALDTPWYDEDEDLALFLDRLGIARSPRGDQGAVPAYLGDPDFDWDTALELTGDALPGETLVLTDHGGTVRLIRTSLGRGSVAVTGIPYFMRNFHLEKRQNAVMTWNLFSAGIAGENPGVLFIRGDKTIRSLWGKLAERGDFTFLVISIPLVLVIGFWMVLPGFGPVLQEEAEPLKSIRERFIAEGRFLKKYDALDTYLEIYVREIKSRLPGQGRGGTKEGPGELAVRIHNALGAKTLVPKAGEGKNRDGPSLPDIQSLTDALCPDRKRGRGEAVKDLIILQTILEYV